MADDRSDRKASERAKLVERLKRSWYYPKFVSSETFWLFVAGALAMMFGFGAWVFATNDPHGLWWVLALGFVGSIMWAYRTNAAVGREVQNFARDVRLTWGDLAEDLETGMPAVLTPDERLETVKHAIEMLPRKKRGELQAWIAEVFDSGGGYAEGHRGHRGLEKGLGW
jgi:hypothetical protein